MEGKKYDGMGVVSELWLIKREMDVYLPNDADIRLWDSKTRFVRALGVVSLLLT